MDWWTGFFDDTYAQIGLEQSSSEAQAKIEHTIDLIVRKLGLAAGDTILDQCCGIGRLSVPLARRGLRVIGVEQAARYVDVARSRTAGMDCEFHVGDAFEFVALRLCDGAINWFTSFGYHRDDRVNVKMLERAFASLRPVMLIQEPSGDFAAGMIEGRWTFIRPEGSRETREIENRLYLPHDLRVLFERAGFTEIELCGAEGEPFERSSRRLIVIGRKPDQA